jgi:RNA recognition motif-containing protein
MARNQSLKEFKKHMTRAGVISSAKLMENSQNLQGVVEFKSMLGAETAVKSLHKSKLNGRSLSIEFLPEISLNTSLDQQNDDECQQNQPLPAISTKLFIRNLNFDVTSEALERHMSKAGDILSCHVLTTKQGKSLGCGSVEYYTLKDSNTAMRLLHNSLFHGRQIQLRDDRLELLNPNYQIPSPPPRSTNSSFSSESSHRTSTSRPDFNSSFIPLGYEDHSVYIGNLSDFTSRELLSSHMSTIGPILKSTIFRGRNNLSMNCGLVIYENKEDVYKAIKKLNDTTLDSYQIFVREDRETITKRIKYERDSNGQVRASQYHPNKNRRRNREMNTMHTKRSIYFSNLSWKVTNDELREHMREVGEINRVIIYENGGMSLGMGVIEYCHEESVKKACELYHGMKLYERKLLVRPYSEEKRAEGKKGESDGKADRKIKYEAKEEELMTGKGKKIKNSD